MGEAGFRRQIEALRKRLDAVHRLIAEHPRRAQTGLARAGRQALAALEHLARTEADLRDRNRELTVLHRVARLLHEEKKPRATLLAQVASIVRRGMRNPRTAAVRIRFDGGQWATCPLKSGGPRLHADFRTADGRRGEIEVAYLRRPAGPGPTAFDPEEGSLLESVADMLASYLDRQAAQASLRRAHDNLESRVEDRTAALGQAHEALRTEVAGRRRAEGAVEQREATYQKLLHGLNEGIWVIDKDARTTMVNPRMAQMLGYTAAEMVGKHLFEFADEAGGQEAKRLLARRRRGVKEQHDFEFIRKDGSRLYAALETSRILDDEGRYAGAIAAVMDMTARREAEQERERLLKRLQRYTALLRKAGDHLERRVERRTAELAGANFALQDEIAERRTAEEALRVTNELLERIFSSTHILIAYMDRDFNFIRVNHAYARADDREPEFFVGKNHFDLYPHEENERIFRNVIRTGKPFVVRAKPFEYPGHPERGVTYWDWSLMPVRGARGEISGLVLNLLDVTDRVRAQARLEDERRRLFSVLNVIPGFVLLHGGGDRVSFANHRFLDLFGDPAGRPCYAVMRGRDKPCEVCYVAEILATGQPREWELAGIRGRSYHVWGYPFSDSDGTKLVLELGIDVTERRELERQILEISDEEQRRIGRDIHDLLGQNLAGIAFLSKVLSQRLAAEASPQAAQAIEITALVNQTVAQARAFSRGLCPVEVSEEGLRIALKDVAANVTSVFNIPCTFQCTLPALVFDNTVAVHLYHIAREAVNNAAKHAGPSHVSIWLGEQDGNIVLSVRDDGTGLPEDLGSGKGMGLRIMRYRADMIGASLTLGRAPGGGTQVTCLLPGHKATGRR